MHSCHGILYLNKQYKIESKNNKKSGVTSKEKWQQTRQVLLLSRLQRKLKKRKKITIKIYHLTKSIYSSVVRNSFSCLIVLLAVVWSPELGLYIFLFGWCVCWFVFLSCWSVSGRFGSGRKRGGSLTRVENRKQVWVGLKTGGRLYRCSYAPLW